MGKDFSNFFAEFDNSPVEEALLRRRIKKLSKRMSRLVRVKRFLDRIGLAKLAGPYFNRMN